MNKERMHELVEGIHMIDEIDPADFKTIKTDFEFEEPPAVSIYMPVQHTERDMRRNNWDRIEFKDLAKEAKRQLLASWDEREVKPILEKLDYMSKRQDMELWLEAKKGLAFFLNTKTCYVYNMDMTPTAQVVVGDDYDFAQLNGEIIEDTASRFKLLLLNADFFAVLDGNDQGVHFEEFPEDVKHYFAETFPEFDGEVTALDYYSLEDHLPPYHGWKSRNDVKQEEARKFFRYVDKVMNDEIVRDETDIPVILVTAPEHLHDFREVCTFKALYPKAIEKDPRGLTGGELVARRTRGARQLEAQGTDDHDEGQGQAHRTVGHRHRGGRARPRPRRHQHLRARRVPHVLLRGAARV